MDILKKDLDDLQILIALLSDLIKKKFYGNFKIIFEAGNVTMIKKEESIKL